MRATIPIELKMQCVALRKQGLPFRYIYENVFAPVHPQLSLESFRGKCRQWTHKQWADEDTLASGTYPNFIPHDATVQVNGKGDIIQAWIKQSADEENLFNQVIEAIKEHTEPIDLDMRGYRETEERMLEINLADMHFGLNNDYSNVFTELLSIIETTKYEQINIIIGQDLFHNDDFRGRTSKGTPIEKVDIKDAWHKAKGYYELLIRSSIATTDDTKIIFVKGNHDESLSWAFVQMLKAMFPSISVDDDIVKRKCIFWKGCFIGLTHGDETKGNVNDLRGQFTITFPKEFADANVREIHCSHLHHEKEADAYGVMVRRLSTGNITDEWSSNSGFIGSHKRFMVFEYAPKTLKSIRYLGDI